MKGCLLGIGTIVLGGVTVGEGAIIGAGSLVVKDIPAWTIDYGSPARLADNMISYIENHTMADIHGANGYRFARDFYGREEIAGYFLKLLEGIKNG
jgi:serine acetyltransferase